MLGLKLEQLKNDIYNYAAHRLIESNVPQTLGNFVIEGVAARFKDDAIASAARQAIELEEEIDELKKRDSDREEGEKDG